MSSIERKVLNLLRNTKIKNRLTVSFLLISLIPIFIVGIISFNVSSKAIESKISTYSYQVLSQAGKNIKNKSEQLENFCNELALSKLLQDTLKNYNNTDEDYLKKADIATQMDNYIMSRTSQLFDITDIEIFANDNRIIYGLGYYTLNDKDIEKYIGEAVKKEGAAAWSSAYFKGKNNIIISKQINSVYPREKAGYLFMAADEDVFSSVYKDIEIGEDTNIFIIDRNGIVVSSRSAEIKAGKPYIESSIVSKILAGEKNNKHVTQMDIMGNKNLIVFLPLRNTEWYLVSTIPYSYLNSEIKNMKWKIVYISLTCILFSLILSFVVSRSISIPLNRLVYLMKQAKGGNFSVNEKEIRKDEVGYLSESFNRMIEQIRKLIEQINDEQNKKRETEIQMLQAQINPHFLFNTLNSLRWVAMINQDDSVSEGLGALAQLLKNTIVDKKEFVTVKDEIENIENYIIIQKIRYGTSFSVTYCIGEEFLDCKILKFLLQPIVENAIIHSLEGVDHSVEVVIGCSRTEKGLRISISDNGRGMEEETLKGILHNQKKLKNKLSSIGISNVRERIKLNFGDDYDLEITSELNSGTEVILTIPWSKDKEE